MNVLIVTGGSPAASARGILREFSPDWVIAADSGIRCALELRLRIDRILGDFDSADPVLLQECEQKKIPRLVFPAEKDFTDTELALEEAAEKAGENGRILLLGAIGTRMDHSLANIFLLKKMADRGIPCEIADDFNRIRMLKGTAETCLQKDPAWPYVSLLPVFGDAEGVTLRGFRYPLAEARMKAGYALGVSNELKDNEGRITLAKGYLLLFRTRDRAPVSPGRP